MEENSNSPPSENGNDGVNWVGMNVSSAFFASLERFSCVHVNTMDSDDEDDEEADDSSITFTIVASPSVSSAITADTHFPEDPDSE